uniref:Tyrosine-protein kinase receptor TYRO3 n=1 Tax=Scleropages formosus TaxID=113540 RepID=A0A8C9TS35_SCLFO
MSPGLQFTKSPTNQTVTQGNSIRLGCAVEGLSEPDVVWMKDGEKLYSTDQMYITLEQNHWETFHSVKSVQQQDAGKYWCEAEFRGIAISSEPAWITVEGVPHFVLEPQDVATFPGVPFNLSCAAVGPPEPVEVLWWLRGVQEGKPTSSPSVLSVPGITSSIKFYCEAKNARGISVSRTGTVHIKGEPLPLMIQVVQVQENNVTLAWTPGFTGYSDLQDCTIQVAPPRKLYSFVHLPLLFVLPFALQVIGGLRCYSNYSVRICCSNEVGTSPFSSWVDFQTPEAGLFFICQSNADKLLFISGQHLNHQEQKQEFPSQQPDLSTGRGQRSQNPPVSGHTRIMMPEILEFKGFWLMCSICPLLVDTLGISDELRAKLQDVLIPEKMLTLGHMLGKGEFGSVREAFLKMEDNSVQKVAVKVLKTDITTSSDIEQCLKEAAYMKDFHHPNVIQLIGVSLHRRPQQRLPVPMVILPFMKHGDLHTFLLMSRLGDEPFVLSLHTLIQFMLDIARGMEYLGRKNIIHRDLAARNCMLNGNMTVCVADFGLSKKIYSGDYYRQGSVSKLPVKWIALESLADNVYTTQSDVWAFGVTMWEVMARGQTPYPGVENAEIYEHLIKGERLKQPPDCPADIYEIMHSCWSPVPKCRPSFQQLIDQLESAWAGLSPGPDQEPLLYVNLEGDGDEKGAGQKDWLMVTSGATLAISGDYRYIIGPSSTAEEEGNPAGISGENIQEDVKEEDDDVVIDV